ncbi:Protein MAIN-LIKE 2 [Glycine max]|nr:Protein MAIN-LIKE 2 [Glycine max]
MERRFINLGGLLLRLMGEVTITLDDVASLLHLPIIGTFHSFDTLHANEAVLIQSGSYAWGAAALVHMYDNLNDACKSGSRQLVGYITLLQCWIYEHFPSIAKAFTNSEYDERSPCAYHRTSTKASTKALPTSMYQKRLDRLTTVDVCWMPYDDHCAVREFDLISCFSGRSRLCFEVIDDKWMHFFDYLAPVGQICVVLGQCAPNYMDWFYMILHPFMRPTQPGDPPRHPLVMQDETYVESDMPEYPVATAAMEEAPTHASSDVEQPRHAVACHAIAERLEWLLNLRIVTKATETYDVMQDCLRIARGVSVDHNVYVWSR